MKLELIKSSSSWILNHMSSTYSSWDTKKNTWATFHVRKLVGQILEYYGRQTENGEWHTAGALD